MPQSSPSSSNRPTTVPSTKSPNPIKKSLPCDNGRIKLVTHGVWAFVSFVPSEGSCSSRRWRAERAWSWTRRWQAPSPHGGRNTWSSYSRVCESHSSANKSAKHQTTLSCRDFTYRAGPDVQFQFVGPILCHVTETLFKRGNEKKTRNFNQTKHCSKLWSFLLFIYFLGLE